MSAARAARALGWTEYQKQKLAPAAQVLAYEGDVVVRQLLEENAELRAEVDRLRLTLASALAPVTPRPQPLTHRQREVLDAIVAFRLRHGVSPTQRDLAVRFGRAPNAIALVFRHLEAKGWIRIHRRRRRGIEVLHESGAS